jgi:hypothetical protein
MRCCLGPDSELELAVKAAARSSRSPYIWKNLEEEEEF